MQELINHPAVQAGFAPFLVALIIAELFLRIRLSGLAIIAGFALTVYLVSDFGYEPFTATRKIIWLGVFSTALGLLFGSSISNWRNWLLVALSGGATVWTLLRILEQQESSILFQWGAACAAYVALLVWSMDKLLGKDSLRVPCAATALGLGTGGAALIGASALLGQLGLAIGAAAAAHWVIQLISNQALPNGRMFTLPLSLIAGLIGCLAVLSAQLPWYALAILSGIPLVALLMPLPNQSVRMQSLLLMMACFLFVAAALYFTWRVAGDVPL